MMLVLILACGLQQAGEVFEQGAGPSYLVSVEAESYYALVPPSYDPDLHTWVPDASTAGYSGAGTMRAMPDVISAPGTPPPQDTGYSLNSPRLDFRIDFLTAGQHFVWVRGLAPLGGTDDSVHVGLNGAEVPFSDRISAFGSSYDWANTTMDPGVGAVVVVPSPGVHTVNVWMREDGFVFDKLVLTTDATYLPAGTGPAESARVPEPAAAGGGGAPGGSTRDNDNGNDGFNDRCGLLGAEVLLIFLLAQARRRP